MAQRITADDLAEFVRRAEDAAGAWVRGDMDRSLDLTHHASGFTPPAPLDGPATRHEDRAEGVKESAGYFQGGEVLGGWKKVAGRL